MGDDIQLMEDADSTTNPQSDAGSTRSRVGEENHIIPRRFVMFRKRIITKVASPKGKLFYWWITVAFLGLLSFLFVLVPLLVEQSLTKQTCSDFEGDDGDLPYFFVGDTGRFEICRQKKLVLEGWLGVGRSYISEEKVNTFKHSNDSFLKISVLQRKARNCLRVQWDGLSTKDFPISDCYNISNAYWYGAYEHYMQEWPINASNFDPLISSPFLPHDYLFSPNNSFGPIVQPLWLNSNGVGIIVDEQVQLHVSMNSTHLCLIAQPYELDCTTSNTLDRTSLNYTVCVFDTVAQVAQYLLNHHVSHPNSTPSFHTFSQPVWSTQALQSNLTTENVADICEAISGHNFTVSQLEIGDGYSQHYGELDFNANVNLQELRSCSNVNIAVWIHPFVNYNASNFETGVLSDMYLPGLSQTEGNSVSLVHWWQGFGAVINFMENRVVQSFTKSLALFMQRIDVATFKFDGGEYTYLPKCIHIEGLTHPGEFTKAYAEFVGGLPYSDGTEVRVGYFTQEQPIIVRLLARSSTWGPDNGLQSVLNAVISIGLGGYSFVNPNTIGGNGMEANFDPSTKPSVELYVRWAQLNTFFPVMHFTIFPWEYDNASITDHIRNLTQLHSTIDFGRLATESLKTGFPIIRPLWWRAVEVSDDKTWTISDQFFIGDEYMVAPVLNMNQRLREVYFPLGANYTLVETSSSPSLACPTGICQGGSMHTFDVSLFQVLFFNVVVSQ